MTVCAFRCKSLLIETSYGDISLQVPHTFIIIAIYKPALKSWKKWEISSFFFPYVRLLSISMNETSFLLALDKWRFPFRNMSCQFIGCSRFYVWGKTTQKKNWVTGKLMKGAGDWIGDFFSLSPPRQCPLPPAILEGNPLRKEILKPSFSLLTE